LTKVYNTVHQPQVNETTGKLMLVKANKLTVKV